MKKTFGFKLSILLLIVLTHSILVYSQTMTRVTGAANWNAVSTWVKSLTGTVTCSVLSTTVTGSGTLFTSEIAAGDILTTTDGQQIGTVSSISSNTSLTLTSNAAVLITIFTAFGSEKVPGSGDNVQIGNTLLSGAVNVTFNTASATVNSLTFVAQNQSHTLTHSGNNALTVLNNVTINQPTANSKTIAWNINGGVATVSGLISFSGANSTASRVGKIAITTGTLNANGGITFIASASATKVIDMSGGAGNINLKGALTVPANSGTLTAGTTGSIFNYADNQAQTINYFPGGKYFNLHINNTSSSGATLSDAITTGNVEGNVSVGDINSGSLFNSGNYDVNLNNAKTVTVATGSVLDAGTSQISFGTGSPALTINGTFRTARLNGFSGSGSTSIHSSNPPAFSLGNGSTIEYYAGSDQTISARSDYANITVSGNSIKTPNGSLTIAGDLVINSGSVFNASSYQHNLAGDLNNSGTFTASTSNINFNGNAQTIPGLTYFNLQTSTGGTKSASGNITVQGNFAIGSSTTFAAGAYTHAIAGNFTNNGTFLPNTSTILFDGPSAQSINGTFALNKVIVNNSNVVSLSNSVTVNDSLILKSGAINLNGQTLTLNGTLTADPENALIGSATSSLEIGSSFSGLPVYFDQAVGNNYLKDLTISNNVALGNPVNITAGLNSGTVNIGSGDTLISNDFLTLKSDSIGTARIATLPTDGSGNSTAYITGSVTIERYIPSRKAWRLLSVPVNPASAPTINEAWQEGVTTSSSDPNLYPGFGTHITGGTTANGFDQGVTNNPSIKVFNNSGALVALPSTPGTNIPITNYPGYFLYIRGDRSVNLMQGVNAPATATTLRIRGEINTGKYSQTVSATNYSLVGNPYPSAVDFHTLTKENVNDVLYVWDPKLEGTNGIGGYVTLSWNDNTADYDATSSVSPVSQFIPSGGAVLVTSSDAINTGTVTFHESDKTPSGNDQVFRTFGSSGPELRVNLYSVAQDGSGHLLDGILTTYNDNNLNNVDAKDARKLNNSNENIGILRENKLLAIERRKTITIDDTTNLSLFQMRIANYKLEIIMNELEGNGNIAYLRDNYAGAANDILLAMNGTTEVPFSITGNPATYAPGRFSIIFVHLKPVPLLYKSLKAFREQKNIAVELESDNDQHIKSYELEKSSDGINFQTINLSAIITSRGNSRICRFIDPKALPGNNYYRVLIISRDDSRERTNIAKVYMANEPNEQAIIIYPNPVEGNVIRMNFNNVEDGFYNIQLINAGGQPVAIKNIQHNQSNPTETFDVAVPAGKYQVKLTGKGVNISTSLFKK